MDADKDIIFLIAELKSSITNLNANIEILRTENRELRTEVKEIKAQMNRWKGALPVIIAIGGVLAFFITILDKIKTLFI